MDPASKYCHPEITLAVTDADLKKCMNVRYQVFIIEQKYPAYIEENEPIDPIADHYLLTAALINDPKGTRVPVGTVRFHQDDNGVAILSRLAILADARGHSYGRKLVEFVIAAAKERQCQALTLTGQYDKRSFYKHLGFSMTDGRIFHRYTVPHCYMTMSL
ncbi:acyl-CoA N-acyltransferase [Dichotomocladium elegans]|nr:acyl-CoA N-acyltransferase [Dichotomocladium elegans]